MKKHSLIDHWNDVSMWWYEVHGFPVERDKTFLIAYERWTNDKDLLTVEDDYEFIVHGIPDPVLDHPGLIGPRSIR